MAPSFFACLLLLLVLLLVLVMVVVVAEFAAEDLPVVVPLQHILFLFFHFFLKLLFFFFWLLRLSWLFYYFWVQFDLVLWCHPLIPHLLFHHNGSYFIKGDRQYLLFLQESAYWIVYFGSMCILTASLNCLLSSRIKDFWSYPNSLMGDLLTVCCICFPVTAIWRYVCL